MLADKKSQITIFIIIGVVMIAAVGLFFYFRSAVTEKAETVAPEAMPIKNLVEDCMYTIAKEGITALGLNGGYISFPPEIENNPLSYMSVGPIISNPFWWYEGVSKIPAESEIKQQISEHVTSQLKGCINNFEDFEDIYTIKEMGSIITRTQLNEENVIIEVNYPVEISSTTNSTKTKLANYRASVPIRLKKAYELAKAVMERENIDAFIEEKTIDLISMSSEDDIPLNHIETFNCGEREWYISDIKQNLRELLRRNLQFIKIAGTNYNDQSYMPIPEPYSRKQTFDESYYNYHYVWTVMENPPEDMHVAFTYDDVSPAYDMSMYARPSRGNKLISNAQKGQDMLKFFCMHIWHFTYDISFPVMVTINDDKADNHDEFSFVFAFKANIDHNLAARKNIATSVFRTADRDSNEEYCSELENEITIHTIDKITAYPVEDVNLTFACGGFNCPIGITRDYGYGADALLTTRFPYCVQGILRGTAEGYDESQEIIWTNIEGREFDLYMTPVKEITDYVVVKHPFENNVVSPGEYDLEADEKATILIKRKKGDDEFETFGAYPTTDSLPMKLLAKGDFTYEIDISLIDDKKPIGGYKGNWTITEQELENLNRIKFHVVETKAGEDAEVYAFMEGLTEYSKNIPLPEIS